MWSEQQNLIPVFGVAVEPLVYFMDGGPYLDVWFQIAVGVIFQKRGVVSIILNSEPFGNK